MPKNIKAYNPIFDLIRVVAIIGVVANHLYYPIYSRPDFFQGKAWYLALFMYCFSLVSVPLFIILSGLLMIPKKESVKQNFYRIYHRLLFPLMFWFAAYLLWRRLFRLVSYPARDIASFIFTGNMHVYYFLVILIGLYLILPIFRQISRDKSGYSDKAILFGSFIVGIIFYLSLYIQQGSVSGYTFVTYWLPFVGYFWWGYWLTKYPPLRKSSWYLLAFLIFFLLTICISYLGIETHSAGYQLAFRNGVYLWNTFLSPPVIIMSIALFSYLLTSSKIKHLLAKPAIKSVVKQLAILSYGVFLIHSFVIDFIDIRFNFAIEFVGTDLINFSLIRPVLALVLSFALAWCISKLPYLKRTIGIS